MGMEGMRHLAPLPALGPGRLVLEPRGGKRPDLTVGPASIMLLNMD